MRGHLLLCILLLSSCGYVMFVDKSRVIYNQSGYIVFYYEQEEAWFFPCNDTVDNHFLRESHLDGYRIRAGEKDLQYLTLLALNQTAVHNVLQNGKSIQVNEPLKLIPVNIRYYWDEKSALKLQKVTRKSNIIRFEYASKEIELIYRICDHRSIMSITPRRESDIERAGLLYIPADHGER